MKKISFLFLSFLASAANASNCGVLELAVSGQGAIEEFSKYYRFPLNCSEPTSHKDSEIQQYVSEIGPEKKFKTDEVETGEELKVFYDEEQLIVSFRKTELLGFESHGDEQITTSPITNTVEIEAPVIFDNEQSATLKGDKVEIELKMSSVGASKDSLSPTQPPFVG